MKIVLTGATGFIGAEVLRQLIDRPDVTQVTCLTRRPVAAASDKVVTHLQDDFTRYDEGLLAGHHAAIWALGARFSSVGDLPAYERLTVGYTLAFATAFADANDPARLCYVSGAGADPAGASKFPIERVSRHQKGRAETALGSLADHRPGLRVFFFRPAAVLPATANPVLRALMSAASVGVAELARAMIDVAAETPAGVERIIPNAQIRRLGRS